MALKHRTVDTNGIRMRVAEQGAGPLVILLSRVSGVLVLLVPSTSGAGGGRIPRGGADMRGYGETDQPEEIDCYKLPQLRGTILLPGCGHWTQQERPAEVNAAMIDFLRGL